MYFVIVVLLLFVPPQGSVAVEALWLDGGADTIQLAGK